MLEEDELKLLDPIVQEEIKQLQKLISTNTNILYDIKRKNKIGIFCCDDSENSNGWNHNGNCKNWVLTF